MLPTREDLTPEKRAVAYTVIDNIDAWLSKERWLKGGWFAVSDNGPERGYHTECLANMIRRVEKGGVRTSQFVADLAQEDYAETRSMTEGIIALSIQECFPGEVRHMHYQADKLKDWRDPEADNGDEWEFEGPFSVIDPADCMLRQGKPCATCAAERYRDEITIQLEYGPFHGDSGDGVIPQFNDHVGTRHADVQRVIDHAREIVSGVTVTNAEDIMSEQERIDVELASIDAQAEIDLENTLAWFEGLERRGWFRRKLIDERDLERRIRRIRMNAEKDKEVVRQDCTNCA